MKRNTPLICSDISTNDLNEKVRTLAISDSRFAKGGKDDCCGTWVSDLVNEDGSWKAVIQSSDGKYYEVSVMIDGEKVTLGTDAKEVIRKTEYEPTSAKNAILCSASVQISPVSDGKLMFMPAGAQEITPMAGGIGKAIKVMVDQAGASALEEQRKILASRGKRAYFDLNHEDGPASFWPSQFSWRPEGIFASGEWTARGKQSVEGKEFREFSPVFHVDNKRGDPARIICNDKAHPNMGGLVNNAAFHNILPLWAKNADGAQTTSIVDNPHPKDNMTPEQIAALQAKNKELETELTKLKDTQSALKAKNESDALVAAEIRAKEQELKANAATLENESLKAKNLKQDEAIKARNKADAEAAVKAAVERGAVLAKDEKTQTALVAQATENPAFLDVIAAMQGSPALAGRITKSANGGRIEAGNEAPNAIVKAYYSIVERNSKLRLSPETHKEKGKLAREAAALYAKEIEKNDVLKDMPIEEAIRAADVSDTNVGLLSGTLVLQRALPLMLFEYPILTSVFSDFSDAPGLLNQTEETRIVVKPAVQTYDTSTDTTGRPKGWSTVSPAQAVDVPIKLDEYVGVPIVFGVNTLAQTMRRLFEEQAPVALNALGGYFVKKVCALFTAANFNAYAGSAVTAVTTVSGSASVTVTTGDTTQMYKGQAVLDSGNTNIPLNTYVASITDSTHFVMTQKAKASNTGVALILGPGFDDAGAALPLPNAFPTYIKAISDFAMSSLTEIGAAMSSGMVSLSDRSILLNSQYYGRLAADPSFNTFFAAMRSPEIVTEGRLPKLQGFNPQDAPWFPSSSNRVGFAYQKAAALLKTRLPQDFTQAVGAMVPGSVTTVTAPGGLSVLLVQYVNLQGNYAEWRPEIMLGAAVGDTRAGLVLTSA